MIADHNELVGLVKRLGLNIQSLPVAMPADSEALYTWLTPIILGSSRSISTIDSEKSNMIAAMSAFKEAQGEIQYLYFVAEGRQGEEVKAKIFGDQKNMQIIAVHPPEEVKHDFYRKRYTQEENLEYALSDVLAALSDLQRRAMNLHKTEL